MSRVVLGLTGAFGSGCTTAAYALRDDRGFKYVRLSDVIKDTWKKLHKRPATPTRGDLQNIGDQLRQDQGPSALINLAIDKLPKELPEKIVIDGIRNVGEIERLQEKFGYEFILIAVLSSSEARWERIKSVAYIDQGLSEEHFHQDDLRDRDEDIKWGQQVELCIDRADITIDNSDDVTLPRFKKRVLEFADLVTGVKPRPATQSEIWMHIAYASSHGSKCLKRHVGAVLISQAGDVVGTGYNENPRTTKPCAEEPDYHFQCYRDIVRNQHFASLNTNGVLCPKCGKPLEKIVGPPWVCKSCQERKEKTNLESFFFPDRAMNWCTAVHAEVWAIIAAGDRARGATLYSTTFPCMQCAEKLTQAGVVSVLYTEAYPDIHGLGRLKLAKVEVRRFEGVRSSAFERIFSGTRPNS